jgi:hypothetical protein
MVMVTMIIVAMIVMVVMVVVVVVVVMILVIIMIFIAMIIVVMIVMIPVVIMIFIAMIVAMSMHNPIKMFCLPINSRGAKGRLNGKSAVVGQAPLEDITELTIDGVVLRLAIEVGFETAMPLDRDHRSDTKFTFWQLLTTAMAAMGMNTTNGSVTGKKQGQCRSGIEE